MKWGEAFEELLKGEQLEQSKWNGLHKQIMYVTIQNPDENSMNTEPYLMMHIGTYIGESPDGGWSFKRFPWMPSRLDLFSQDWKVRKTESKNNGI